MDKVVKEYLKQYGYEDCIDEKQETRVTEWLKVFEGPTERYKVKIYNGTSYVTRTINSLGLAHQMCGDLADFFFNEKLEITLSNKSIQKQIEQCLEQNSFLKNGNKLMQLVKALGTGAFVPYLDNGVLRINYLNASNIVILKTTTDGVVDVLFYTKRKIKERI